MLIYDGVESPTNGIDQRTTHCQRRSARLRKRRCPDGAEPAQTVDAEGSKSLTSKRENDERMCLPKRGKTDSDKPVNEVESATPMTITRRIRNSEATPCSNGVGENRSNLQRTWSYHSDDRTRKGVMRNGIAHSPSLPISKKITPTLMTATELAECRHSVDLRMIDFARSTHGGHYDQIEYDGLDECYLTGLSSLLKIFREMAEDKTT